MSGRPATSPPHGRHAWRLWGVLIVSMVALGAAWAWQRTGRVPNVLFITLDTTRADRIGCYGYEPAETPRIDELARRGVLFERAYATAPMTAPSHASMFTGLFPPEHGVYTNGIVALEPDIPVLADQLRRGGYATAAFVASVVLQAKSGFDRGFDLYDDDLSAADADGDELHRSRDGKHVIDAAVRWLGHRPTPARPFFCWVHLFDPHHPYLSHSKEFGEKFQQRPYDGELAYVDRQLERLFETVTKLGLNHNTVIVVVGDHGESLGEHGEETHGYLLHESTLCVPLIIYDPRQASAGRRVSTLVSLADLFPTLLSLAGLRPPEGITSRNLAPALEGRPLPDRICYSQTLEPFVEAGWAPLQGITTDRWRYVRTTQVELYDLAADPAELKNLAADLPDRVSELDGELAAFEGTLHRRSGSKVKLSERELRSLESLGYTGGGSGDAAHPEGAEQRPDIKEMIGPLNQLFQAQELIEHHQYPEAEALLRPLAENVPNFMRARFTLGLCRLKQEQYEDAVKWLEAALEIDPGYARAQLLAGFCELKLRKLPEAEAHLKRAVELDPNSENAHLYLGEVYQRQEQFPLAIRHYAETLRINPRNRQAREVFEALRQAGYRP